MSSTKLSKNPDMLINYTNEGRPSYLNLNCVMKFEDGIITEKVNGIKQETRAFILKNIDLDGEYQITYVSIDDKTNYKKIKRFLKITDQESFLNLDSSERQ